MNELVPQSNIHNYAIRNTSPKMPIEQKYLEAFISAIFSSPELKELYERLQNIMWNEDSPMMFLSLWDNIGIINNDNIRPIVAYAMLRKDEKLFEMISSALFTGTFEVQWDQNFVKKIVHYTDENMAEEGQEEELPYTDTDLYTDMVEGIPFLVFHNIYCDDIPNDPVIQNRYQTLEELKENLDKFKILITVCKPARAEIIALYEPWVYVSMENPLIYAGTKQVLFDNDKATSSTTLLNYLKTKTNNELLDFYNNIYSINDRNFIQNESFPSNITPSNFIEFQGQIYVSDGKNIRVARDGVKFEVIAELENTITAMEVFNNKLYVAVASSSSSQQLRDIYVSVDGKKFSRNKPIFNEYSTNAIIEYNGLFLAGTSHGIYVASDASTNVLDFEQNESFPSEYNVQSFVIYNDRLYVGTSTDGLFYSDDGITYQKLTNYPVINARTMISFNGILFIGTAGYKVYYSLNGFDFKQMTYTDSNVFSFAIYNNNLYAGTSYGVYVLNPNTMQFVYVWGGDQMYTICSFNNELYAGGHGLHKSSDGIEFTTVYSTSYIVQSSCVHNNKLYITTWYSGTSSQTPYSIKSTSDGSGFSGISLDDDYEYYVPVQKLYEINGILYAGCGGRASTSSRPQKTSLYYLPTMNTLSPCLNTVELLNAYISSLASFNGKLYATMYHRDNYGGAFCSSDGITFVECLPRDDARTNSKLVATDDALYFLNMGSMGSYDNYRLALGETTAVNIQITGEYNKALFNLCKFQDKIYAINNNTLYVSTDNGFHFSKREDISMLLSSISTFNDALYLGTNAGSLYISYNGDSFISIYRFNSSVSKIYAYNHILYAGILNNGFCQCENLTKPEDQFIITNKSITDYDEFINGTRYQYRMMKIEIMTTTKDPFIWGTLKLLSNDSSSPTHLPDITIIPDNVVSEQKTSSKYFITIQLKFPKYTG